MKKSKEDIRVANVAVGVLLFFVTIVVLSLYCDPFISFFYYHYPGNKYLSLIFTFYTLLIGLIVPISFDVFRRIFDRYKSFELTGIYKLRSFKKFFYVLLGNLLLLVSYYFVIQANQNTWLTRFAQWFFLLNFFYVSVLLYKHFNHLLNLVFKAESIIEYLIEELEKKFKESTIKGVRKKQSKKKIFGASNVEVPNKLALSDIFRNIRGVIEYELVKRRINRVTEWLELLQDKMMWICKTLDNGIIEMITKPNLIRVYQNNMLEIYRQAFDIDCEIVRLEIMRGYFELLCSFSASGNPVNYVTTHLKGMEALLHEAYTKNDKSVLERLAKWHPFQIGLLDDKYQYITRIDHIPTYNKFFFKQLFYLMNSEELPQINVIIKSVIWGSFKHSEDNISKLIELNKYASIKNDIANLIHQVKVCINESDLKDFHNQWQSILQKALDNSNISSSDEELQEIYNLAFRDIFLQYSMWDVFFLLICYVINNLMDGFWGVLFNYQDKNETFDVMDRLTLYPKNIKELFSYYFIRMNTHRKDIATWEYSPSVDELLITFNYMVFYLAYISNENELVEELQSVMTLPIDVLTKIYERIPRLEELLKNRKFEIILEKFGFTIQDKNESGIKEIQQFYTLLKKEFKLKLDKSPVDN